jgi:hypothetical protein
MKSKTKKIMYAFLAALFILMVSSYGIATSGSHAAGASGAPKLENLNGKSEFYFTPAGDNRVWHIVNKYGSPDSDRGINEASYFFTSDSVYVICEYAGITNSSELNLPPVSTALNENKLQ